MEIEVESGCRSNVNINMKNKQAEGEKFPYLLQRVSASIALSEL